MGQKAPKVYCNIMLLLKKFSIFTSFDTLIIYQKFSNYVCCVPGHFNLFVLTHSEHTHFRTSSI